MHVHLDGPALEVRTVLLVDDQPAFLQLTQARLSGHPGFTVVGSATNGEEALALLLTLKPEVVILDVHMPQANGFETAHRLLRASPRLRIVLVSATDEPQYETLARAIGAVAFLPKKALSADAIARILQAL